VIHLVIFGLFSVADDSAAISFSLGFGIAFAVLHMVLSVFCINSIYLYMDVGPFSPNQPNQLS